jgi:hypothetical protein
MSERSKRRAAEMGVIHAAVRWERIWSDITPIGDLNQAAHDLVAAVRAYEALGLEMSARPALGNGAPDTSAEAAASMVNHVGTLARLVFDEIAVVHESSGGGLTVDQVEQITRRSHQSVSARVNELRDKGWLVDSGQRRKTRSGRNAIVWVPTVQALAVTS